MDHRHASAYGPRARLGLIVPPTNTVNEAEWQRMMPPGVTFHTHRMKLHTDSATPDGARRLMDDLEGVFALLGQCGPDVIAYACTAGSMTTPVEDLPCTLTRRTGIRALTTAAAIIAALRALGVARLSVATPYAQALNDHEAHFLSDHGFEVARLIGLGIGAGGPHEYPRIARTDLAAVEAHARAAFVPGSDALLITCTDFPTLPLIDRLEADLGVPVVTSNQATLWAALRASGLDDAVPGAGRLFAC
jgi:maleate cis-trans isomerase